MEIDVFSDRVRVGETTCPSDGVQVDRNNGSRGRPFGMRKNIDFIDRHALGGAQIGFDQDQRENLQADSCQKLSAAADNVNNGQGKGQRAHQLEDHVGPSREERRLVADKTQVSESLQRILCDGIRARPLLERGHEQYKEPQSVFKGDQSRLGQLPRRSRSDRFMLVLDLRIHARQFGCDDRMPRRQMPRS
ncbi:hypothetical protein BDW75DRAFT_74410 [Aspergillus navahoensis]